ncbi:MAG: UDP-2,4-diacetamido-2,4,6-trideoxy-beta-L-altropyranose hydrolase [Caulobacterales bacterium]
MTPGRRILFFADAGPQVGGGHVMRCLTLARALTERGAECAFVESRAAAPILRRFGWPAQTLLAMISTDDLSAQVDYARRIADLFAAQVVVIDHYKTAAADERRLAGDDRRVAVIDDLADRSHACDLILDPGFGRRPEAYSALAAAAQAMLTGPSYALVRQEFADARPRALSRRAKHGPVTRALVSLGLTDVDGVTSRVVRALVPVLGEVRVDVVLGEGAASLEDLTKLTKSDRRVHLWVDTAEMASLMADADVAIGAGGSSVWERCVVGLPSITLSLADNQRPMAQAMAKAGFTLAVDARAERFETELQTAWTRLVTDRDLRWRLAERAADLCDGQGTERVAEAVMGL